MCIATSARDFGTEAGRLLRALQTLAARAPDVASVEALAPILTDFASRASRPAPLAFSRGRYPRALLSHPEDPFQAVICFWPPGARSAIHDHAATWGGVVSLYGRIAETKYRVRRRGACYRLSVEATTALAPGVFSPIHPEDGKQVHDMRNEGLEWAATLHVYLRPMTSFGIYRELATGDHHREVQGLWFDATDAARTWPRPAASRGGHRPAPAAARGGCGCGAVRVEADAAPVLQLRCHCTDCQREHRASVTPWVGFDASAVWLCGGPIQRRARRNDSGHWVTRSFCEACGDCVLLESSASPQIAMVPLAALEDGRFFVSQVDLYARHRAAADRPPLAKAS